MREIANNGVNGAFVFRILFLAITFGSVFWSTVHGRVGGLNRAPIAILATAGDALGWLLITFCEIVIFVLVFGIFVPQWDAPSWRVSLFNSPLNPPHFLITFAVAFSAGLLAGSFWYGPQAFATAVIGFASALGGWLGLRLMMYLFRGRIAAADE